jgi:hypothetical protein
MKSKRKTKQNYPGFEFKPCHVNDSSQANQVTVHLVSQRLTDLFPLHRLVPLRRLQRCRVRRTNPLVRRANPKSLSTVPFSRLDRLDAALADY